MNSSRRGSRVASGARRPSSSSLRLKFRSRETSAINRNASRRGGEGGVELASSSFGNLNVSRAKIATSRARHEIDYKFEGSWGEGRDRALFSSQVIDGFNANARKERLRAQSSI